MAGWRNSTYPSRRHGRGRGRAVLGCGGRGSTLPWTLLGSRAAGRKHAVSCFRVGTHAFSTLVARACTATRCRSAGGSAWLSHWHCSRRQLLTAFHFAPVVTCARLWRRLLLHFRKDVPPYQHFGALCSGRMALLRGDAWGASPHALLLLPLLCSLTLRLHRLLPAYLPALATHTKLPGDEHAARHLTTWSPHRWVWREICCYRLAPPGIAILSVSELLPLLSGTGTP